MSDDDSDAPEREEVKVPVPRFVRLTLEAAAEAVIDDGRRAIAERVNESLHECG